MPNVALVDPKHIDGEPWDVASTAGQQLIDSLELALEAFEGFYWAARGAWLSQEDHRLGAMPEGEAFNRSPLGRRLQNVQQEIRSARKDTRAAKEAASFDPRSY